MCRILLVDDDPKLRATLSTFLTRLGIGTPIQAADGQRWFRRKAVGGLGFEDRVRDGLNALRYRGATE